MSYRHLALALLASLAILLPSAANACSVDPAQYYDELDRVLIIRCAPTGPVCYSILVAVKDSNVVAGRLDAMKGIGLRGVFSLVPSTGKQAPNAWDVLGGPLLSGMTPPPAMPAIDGTLDIIAVRRCGRVTVARTLGIVSDASHLDWILRLDDLQSRLLNLQWARVSENADVKQMGKWFANPLPSELFEP